MKVRELMTSEPRTCTPDTSMAEAASLMWEADCGILPVVQDGALVGVVTDRDMYIALATKNARPSGLTVGALLGGAPVVTCAPEDDIHDALAAMKRARVHRLPVVGFGNSVLGMLSLNDVTRVSGEGQPIPSAEIVDTLRAIGEHHRHPEPHVVAA